ncbi:MAG TPA: membrane dipeptidase [Thermoanaerobaculia bacterium]|nr:membrane dipeptidase [Thermoanaerobaculia bacterium]
MNRRELFGLAAATGAALSWPASGAGDPAAPPAAKRRMRIDGCGEAFDPDGPWPLGGAALASLAAAGLTAVNFTVVGPGADFEKTVRAVAFVQGTADRFPDRLIVVRRAADLDRAADEGRTGLVMGFQTTGMLGEDLDRIDVFGRLGVRIMQLTYNDRSLYGDGCLEPSDAGLSRLGRRAVERMNASGITIDVSHSGDRTTREAIEASRKPIVISHAGCRAVFPHPRNKEDAALKALADRGGVVGIYLMPFLSAGPGPITPEDLHRHVAHAVEVCGEDHVGIGTDQGVSPVEDTPEYRKNLAAEVEARRKAGVSAPGESADRPPFIPEFNRADRFARLAEDFGRRGMAPAVIDKVLGGNFERVFRETWEEK